MQTQKCSKCDRGWDLNEAAMSVESCGADLHDKGQTFQNGRLVSALQLQTTITRIVRHSLGNVLGRLKLNG